MLALIIPLVCSVALPRSPIETNYTTLGIRDTTRAQIAVAGTVQDAAGQPVPGADVAIVQGTRRLTTTRTDAEGRFRIEIDSASRNLEIVVTAPGFEQRRAFVGTDGTTDELQVTLHPAPLIETVTVTATRGGPETVPLPSSVTVLSASELAATAALTLDDVLRATPGFSLFRRASSRAANPTTQGVTLRGLSASGASRTVVLADGVPLNDAFGGWVAWSAVPRAAIERVEVVRGAAGDLYGADALGGVIQVFTWSPDRAALRLALDGGSEGTARGSGAAGGRRGAWSGLVASERLVTDGFQIVGPAERGAVDTRASTRHVNALARATFTTGRGIEVSGRVTALDEDRGNGTPLQVNDTNAWSASAGLQRGLGRGLVQASLFVKAQGYDQSFTAVARDRQSEMLTQRQRVPSRIAGVSGEWAAAHGSSRWLLGVDHRDIDARTQETRFTRGVATEMLSAGGRGRLTAVFGQVGLEPAPGWSIVAGTRAERWSVRSDATGRTRDGVMVAPRLSAAWRASAVVSLHASVSRAFRAPTLNERYRSFRAGDTLTLPNEALEPEALTTVEGGARLEGRQVAVRATAFWNLLDRAIANVTTSVAPALTTRERRNAGEIRAAGAEIEARTRLPHALTVSASAVVGRSRWHRAAEPLLVGKRIPQTPWIQGSLELQWTPRTGTVAVLQSRLTSAQYEDDRNELVLQPAALLDAYASHPLARSIRVFAALENVLDTEYDVGRMPLRTIGTPRALRAGLSVELHR